MFEKKGACGKGGIVAVRKVIAIKFKTVPGTDKYFMTWRNTDFVTISERKVFENIQ